MMYAQSLGHYKSYSNVDKPNVVEMNWDAHYDGNKVHVEGDVLKDGQRETFSEELPAPAAERIMEIPVTSGSLIARLSNDFQTPVPLLSTTPRKRRRTSTQKHKRKSKSKSKSHKRTKRAKRTKSRRRTT